MMYAAPLVSGAQATGPVFNHGMLGSRSSVHHWAALEQVPELSDTRVAASGYRRGATAPGRPCPSVGYWPDKLSELPLPRCVSVPHQCRHSPFKRATPPAPCISTADARRVNYIIARSCTCQRDEFGPSPGQAPQAESVSPPAQRQHGHRRLHHSSGRRRENSIPLAALLHHWFLPCQDQLLATDLLSSLCPVVASTTDRTHVAPGQGTHSPRLVGPVSHAVPSVRIWTRTCSDVPGARCTGHSTPPIIPTPSLPAGVIRACRPKMPSLKALPFRPISEHFTPCSLQPFGPKVCTLTGKRPRQM